VGLGDGDAAGCAVRVLEGDALVVDLAVISMHLPGSRESKRAGE